MTATTSKRVYAATLADEIAASTRIVRAVALKYTKCPEAANDLANDVLLKALENQDKFEPGSNLKAWLCTITRNTFITDYNKHKRFVHVGVDGISDSWDYTPRCHNTASDTLTAELVDDAINQLSEKDQIIMRGRIDGYRYHELADMVDVPIGTIKNRIHINRAKLTEYMRNPTDGVLLTAVMEEPVTPEPNETMVAPPPQPGGRSTTKEHGLRLHASLLTYLRARLTDTPQPLNIDILAEVSKASFNTLRNFTLPALVELGALQIQKNSRVNWYRRMPLLDTLTPEQIQDCVRERGSLGPKPKLAFFSKETASEPEPDTIEAEPRRLDYPEPVVACAQPTSQQEIDDAIAAYRKGGDGVDHFELPDSGCITVSNSDDSTSVNSLLYEAKKSGILFMDSSQAVSAQFSFQVDQTTARWFNSYDEAALQARAYLTAARPSIEIVRHLPAGQVALEFIDTRY